MKPHIQKLVVLFLLCIFVVPVLAGDLDDGIAIDEKIDDELTTERNLDFQVLHAKTKSNSVSETTGVGNIDLGVGNDLRGATIINVSDNEDAVVVSE